MHSPIRYFGGKGGMYSKIIAEFPSDFGTHIKSTSKGDADVYIEPYGGGASVLFHKEQSPIEIYNDIDHNVCSLFFVLADKKKFKQFKSKCDVTYYSREIFKKFVKSLREDDLDMVERAFRFFYVNRVAYNGVGGFSSIVKYVRNGMSKPVSDMLSAIKNLPEVHNRLSTVIIENGLAIDLIEKYDDPHVLFYLDPPYHHSTRTEARYDVDMSDEEHELLIMSLLRIKKARVLLSGYQCELYDKLTEKGWHRVDFDVKTQDGKRNSKKKVESLWRNYKKEGNNENRIGRILRR